MTSAAVAFVDEQSLVTFGSSSAGSKSLGEASCPSYTSKGILKRRTMEESLCSLKMGVGGCSSNCSFGTAVTFDSVEINEHPITLGDNPSVADGGPPIEIEWEAQSYEVTTVDDFEDLRLARTAARRGQSTDTATKSTRIRKLGPQERTNLLIKAGFSQDELNKSEDDMSTLRLMREMTKRRAQREAALAASSSSLPNTTTDQPLPNNNGRPSEMSKASRTLIKRFRLRRSVRRSFSSTI